MAKWKEHKKKGNTLYGLCHYEEALQQYSKALHSVEQDDENVSPAVKTEIAKMYSNRSVTRMKLAMGYTGDKKKEYVEEALSDGRKALELDPSFHKAHFRCGDALVHLQRWHEVADCVSRVLSVHKGSATQYTEDTSLLSLMKQCSYFTRVKDKSPNWVKVKFKDNCKVIDPYGAGDYTDLGNVPLMHHDKVSLLVRPGEYRVTSDIVVHLGKHVDVVGDVSEKEEVIFTASGSVFSPEACSIFAVMGGKLKLTQITLNQTSNHPERHAVFTNHSKMLVHVRYFLDAEVELEDVKGYSKSSGCLGILNTNITMRRCEFNEACGGVILSNSTTAVIESCKFRNCSKIGIELRDGSTATVLDTEVSGSGSQGIVCHAEAKGFTVTRCTFHNNCRYLRSEPAVSVACGHVTVSDTRLTDNIGGGVMAHNGGKVRVEKCHISGGRYGVAASLKGSALVRGCHLENLTFGVSVILNLKGKIRLENNTMKGVLREVQLTPDDDVPVMVGTQHTVEVDSGDSVVGAGLNKSGKKDVKKLTQKLNTLRWGEREKERVCSPCGMSQTTLRGKFKQCSGCRIAWYCSQECQRKDWPLHKKECKKIKDLCGM